MGARDCFLTLPAKAAHRPTQVGQRGDPALSPSDLQDFFFFGSYPHSPFLCLCGAVFIQEAPSFDPLIMFYKTLLGDMETLSFPFAAIGCASSNCLKIGPNQCCYGVGIVSLPRLRKPHTTHTAGHAGRSCLTFVPDAFFLCTSRDIFSICCW